MSQVVLSPDLVVRNVVLDRNTDAALSNHAAKTGLKKSEVVRQALQAFLKRK